MTGADPNLLQAVMEGDLAAARTAIEAGANVNATDANQSTALHLAVALAQVELIRLLIEKGADILAKNVSQQTPLEVAQQNGQHEVAAILSDGMQRPRSHAARIVKERSSKGNPEHSR